MRSPLKVDKIRLRLFLLQKSRRTSLSLDLDHRQLNISHAVLRWRRGTSQQEHHFLRILGMQTARDPRQTETSCYYQINKQERQLSKGRTERQDEELVRLHNCRLHKNPQDRKAELGDQRTKYVQQRRSAGIHVKVPSTDNPVMLIWVIACTEEVQYCRQIAAISTVIVMENQNNET